MDDWEKNMWNIIDFLYYCMVTLAIFSVILLIWA